MGEFDEPTQNVEIPVGVTRRRERKPYLTLYSGLEEGRVIPLKAGRSTIGRGDEAEFTFQDNGLSRKHAVFSFEDDQATLSDLGSTNGSFVNGKQISHCVLNDGDHVQFGSLRMKISWLDELDAAFAVRQYRSSKRDTLTGCFNKRHVLELLKTEFAFVRRHGRPVTVLMADIDHFKNLNDTEGHLAGDAVLATVGELLRAELRQPDLIARFGGEEFIMVLRETSRENSVLVAERLRHRIESTGFDYDGKILRVTISIGVAGYPESPIENTEALVELADRALYKAKRAGRNQVSI